MAAGKGQFNGLKLYGPQQFTGHIIKFKKDKNHIN